MGWSDVTDDGEPLGAVQRATLLDALGQAVIATDPGGRITYWNPAAELLYGWTAAEVLGRPIDTVTVPQFGRGVAEQIVARLLEGETWSGAFTVQRRNGTTFTALVTDSAVWDAAGQLVGIVGVSTDVAQMMRPILSQSHEAMVVTDEDAVVRFATTAVERVLGWTDADLAGRSLLDLVHDDERAGVAQCVRRAPAAANHDVQLVEFRTCTPTGEWIWVEGLVANFVEEPSVRGLVWTLRDTSERREALERMTDAALHDPLTGMPNRLLLSDRIAQAAARREPRGALLFIDLDGFKKVNDELGHAAGDTLLRTIADRLARTMRPEDSCGRWAGDEFIVLNEALHSRDEAQALADRLGRVIAEPVEIAGRQVATRASIGVAMLAGTHDPERLLRLADESMYRVKQEHRRDGDPGPVLPP